MAAWQTLSGVHLVSVAADCSHLRRARGATPFPDDIEAVEPLLRRVASHEVRTTVPLNEVVTTILRLVDA
jgi:hypothetical protein